MPTDMPDLGPAVDVGGSIAGIVTLIIAGLGALAWRRLSGWVTEMRTDVQVTKVQTTNSHETNMRDDITKALTKIESMATSVTDMGQSLKSLDSRQAEMHSDLRETRRDLRFTTEYVRDVDKRLNQHLDESRKNSVGTWRSESSSSADGSSTTWRRSKRVAGFVAAARPRRAGMFENSSIRASTWYRHPVRTKLPRLRSCLPVLPTN